METNHTKFWNPVRALAAFLLLGLFGSGYAISTQMGGAVDSPPAVAAASESQAPTDYFPAQYVNQAQRAEEHIQAY